MKTYTILIVTQNGGEIFTQSGRFEVSDQTVKTKGLVDYARKQLPILFSSVELDGLTEWFIFEGKLLFQVLLPT